MPAKQRPIGILGAGAWGCALAEVLAQSGHEVLLWSVEPDVVNTINRQQSNEKYLPGLTLDEKISATNKLDDVVKKCRCLFVAVPSPAATEVAVQVGQRLTADHTIVVAAKGFRESDGALLGDVWLENSRKLQNLAVLGGPSAARDVATRRLTSVVVAANSEELVMKISDLFTVPWFRVYYSLDPIGVQVGGALRNIFAIAAGITAGLDLGHNATAAVVSRAAAEMARYATALGGRTETVMGLSGLGDLWLAIASGQSRNYRFGQSLAQGLDGEAATLLEGTVEGDIAARIVNFQAAARGVDLGLVSMVDGMLHGEVKPDTMIELMLLRPRVWEFDRPEALLHNDADA